MTRVRFELTPLSRPRKLARVRIKDLNSLTWRLRPLGHLAFQKIVESCGVGMGVMDGEPWWSQGLAYSRAWVRVGCGICDGFGLTFVE